MAQAVLALEQFEYIRNIGKGSYGEVTLARHKRDRKQYVLKKINLKKASSRERRSAEQEAKLLSKLKHPNIVSYKDSFEKDGLLYIAMQFCEGGDLYNKLKEQRGTLLDERQLVEWFVQIAMALQYMHERNILHRDLKTQNIFLTKSKIIKVGDLGIARVLDNSSDMATTLIGTPYYMSPELFSNKPYNHKMPPMPRQYGKDLVDLVRNMLHQDPSKRPTVNRILRDPYIKKNIAIFLEETKQSRRPASGRPSSRPQSAKSTASQSEPDTARSRVSIMSNDSESSYDTPDSVRSAVESDRSVVSASQVDMAAGGEPDRHQHRMPSNLEPIIEGQVAGTKDESDQDTIKQSTVKANKPKPEHKDSNEHKENIEHKDSKEPKSKSDKTSAASKSEKQHPTKSHSPPRERRRKKKQDFLKKPKPVDNPRPLPLPPKQDSEGLPQRRNNYNEMAGGDSKSSSSSGSKDDASLGDETPRSLPNMSAREKRRQRDNAQSYDRPQSARIVLVPPESSKSTVITDRDRKRYEQQAGPVRHRQPSIANDSSSSDEDTLKESDAQRQRSKIQQRENRDMDQFISVLDNTLQLNNQDDEEELTEVKVPQDETPRIPKSSSMPSVDTLCNADRLMARINLLHQT
ncbi:NEK4-like protein [Mya arenaria]|uniref:non-specific serine/threonine protein kinase n=1 Tax=Mya arenaria TaxID=6604 RepID=A0ABY7FT96_MYAAR|nr:NEK4-like protein [Mya arenaria]